MTHNPNCDGDHCQVATGEVRVLRLPGDANLIICRACYEHEMRWRRERNQKLAVENRYPLPEWDTLKVYGSPMLDTIHAITCPEYGSASLKRCNCTGGKL